MCGIVGHISSGEVIDITVFNQMRDLMAHRGPDGLGSELLNNGKVALGHRRLSIIDLSSEGRQPMSNEDQTIWITFNGEIYNFKELRKILIETGKHDFKSGSDTEVLIHGYEEWGINGLLTRVKGMFAFGLWDDRVKVLYLARDRFGIKPLVYYADEKAFIFASELKAIMAYPGISKKIDYNSLADYFIYSYIPYPKTIWTGVLKLPPAHILSFDYNSFEIKTSCYWQLKTDERKTTDEDAVNHINYLVKQATEQHLVSDVPVGVFLSGGYDSTTLLMYMSDLNYPTKAFTIAFPDSSQNEANQAAASAKLFGAQHEIETIRRGTDIFSLLEDISLIYDEPFAGDSMINAWMVSRQAARHCKVALSGEGADEVFGGYKWHIKIEAYYKSFGVKELIKNIIHNRWSAKSIFLSLYNRSMPGVMSEAINHPSLNGELKSKIQKAGLWHFEKFYKEKMDKVKLSQYLDTHTFIPNHCLYRADLSSMAHSLEVRVPFLDHEIYEYVFLLERAVYMKPGRKKFLLEERLKKRIPESVLEMPKRGFSFQGPENIFDKRFYEIMRDGKLVQSSILSKNADLSNCSSHLKFHLLNLELWMQNHG